MGRSKQLGFCTKGHDLLKVGRTAKGQCALCRAIQKRDRQNLILYGIKDTAERDALLVSQGNACATCGRTDCKWGRGWLNVWHVDHKHGETGTHRGILCARCNVIVGILETAGDIIQKCRVYLANWQRRTEGFQS